MKLWVDGQCLQTASRLRGIGRYMTDLLRAVTHGHPEVELHVSLNAVIPQAAVVARRALLDFIPNGRIHVWQGLPCRPESFGGSRHDREVSEAALAHHVRCLGVDVALAASPLEGFLDSSVPWHGGLVPGLPSAAIFYDAIPLRFPEHYLAESGAAVRYQHRLDRSRTESVVLAISEFSAQEARALLGHQKVSVIDAGVSPHLKELIATNRKAITRAASRLELPRDPFLLYVGGLDWRKNVAGVIDAFSRLDPHRAASLPLVVGGAHPPSAAKVLREAWAKQRLPEKNLIFTGHVSDAELVALYRASTLVIQPSLMEGFGLTVLEAMECDAPVVAARAGAVPEVVGADWALFDPRSPADIARLIEKAFSEPAFLDDLRKNGQAQRGRYSWERTAHLTVAALSGLVVEPRAVKVQLDEARQATLSGLSVAASTDKRLAEILAGSEPRSPREPLLMVDVTSTAHHDHGTGIQRVVRETVRELLSRPRAGKHLPHLTHGDSAEGFFPVRWEPPSRMTKDRGTAVEFAAGDKVLLLDSSWETPVAFHSVLTRARLAGAEVYSVLYDLVPITNPGFCDPGMPGLFRRWLDHALAYSDGFICISKAVADELLRLLKAIEFPRDLKVGYWHLGGNLGPAEAPPAPVLVPGAPKFLMVGTLEPRKGHTVALDAFDRLWRDGFQGELWVVGKRGWNTQHLIDRIKSHALHGRQLRWFESPDDAELRDLYRESHALIAGSFAEGFGLPIAEAMHQGKPVIASDLPVFREIAAQEPANLFFEVGNAEALAASVLKFANTWEGRAPRIEPGRGVLTWKQSVSQLLAVVDEGRWYADYTPEDDWRSENLEDVHRYLKCGPLGKMSDAECSLTLASQPVFDPAKNRYSLVVRVTNHSAATWSCETDHGARPVMLGYHVHGADGRIISFENPRVVLPLAIGPSDSQCLEVTVDGKWDLKGMTHVSLRMLQETVDWWEPTLKVPLMRA